MAVVTCIDDLREMSRKRVARAIFDYVDRGSYSEATLRANRADLESLYLRQMAKKRVAKAIFDYVDRGSYTESTLRANRADLELLTLRQRVGIDVDKRSTRGTMLGEEVSMPTR